MTKFREKLKNEQMEFKLLLRSIPATVVTLFVVSVICMNLLANKTLVQLEWIALDGGILISWLSFMCSRPSISSRMRCWVSASWMTQPWSLPPLSTWCASSAENRHARHRKG